MKKDDLRIFPIDFEDDIDPKKQFNCNELDKILEKCFFKAKCLILNNFSLNDPRNFKQDLLNILEAMRDCHFVIREIEKNYRSQNESRVLCAIPLVRTQIESVYTIAWMRRNFSEAIELFIISAWKQFYKKSFFFIEETKK